MLCLSVGGSPCVSLRLCDGQTECLLQKRVPEKEICGMELHLRAGPLSNLNNRSRNQERPASPQEPLPASQSFPHFPSNTLISSYFHLTRAPLGFAWAPDNKKALGFVEAVLNTILNTADHQDFKKSIVPSKQRERKCSGSFWVLKDHICHTSRRIPYHSVLLLSLKLIY